MKKYLLVGSYLSAGILIFVSFSSVIGYQFISTDGKGLSPLFNIRIQRAIDVDSKEIKYEYLGQGEESSIQFPFRESEVSLIYKVLKNIRYLDDEWFRYKIRQINRIYPNINLNYENLQEKINTLYQIMQNNKDIITNFQSDTDNPIIKPFTIYRPLYILILLIFLLIFGLYIPIISIYAGVTCDPCCFIYDPKTFNI